MRVRQDGVTIVKPEGTGHGKGKESDEASGNFQDVRHVQVCPGTAL